MRVSESVCERMSASQRREQGKEREKRDEKEERGIFESLFIPPPERKRESVCVCV